MHPVLLYESFFCCSRDDLERLRPLSKSLLNMIVKGSKTLPLRPIHRVHMGVECVDMPDREIEIYVEKEEDGYEPYHDYAASLHVHEGGFAETFRRLQHTCIKNLDVWINDSPFARYWIAQESAVFTVVNFNFHIAFYEYDDAYDAFDSFVIHVRPKTTLVVTEGRSWRENGNEHMKLLARKSLLDRLQTCCLRVSVEGFPPPSFFFNDPGYAKYELLLDHTNVAKWIDSFIESFVRSGCANRKLQSVCVRWEDDGDQKSPAPKQLSKPKKSEIPLPKMDMTALLTAEVRQVTQCELHSFENTKNWTRMDVYKWSDHGGSDRVTHILQCRVNDL